LAHAAGRRAAGRRAAAARRRRPSSKTPSCWKVGGWVDAVPDNTHYLKPISEMLSFVSVCVFQIRIFLCRADQRAPNNDENPKTIWFYGIHNMFNNFRMQTRCKHIPDEFNQMFELF